MQSSCKLPLLSENAHPRDRALCFVAAGLYLTSLAIATIVILCCIFGAPISANIVVTVAFTPAAVRHTAEYVIARRAAAMTGEPASKVLGHLIFLAIIGLLIYFAWIPNPKS